MPGVRFSAYLLDNEDSVKLFENASENVFWRNCPAPAQSLCKNCRDIDEKKPHILDGGK